MKNVIVMILFTFWDKKVTLQETKFFNSLHVNSNQNPSKNGILEK